MPANLLPHKPSRIRGLGFLKALGGLAAIYALWPLGLMSLLGRLNNTAPSLLHDYGYVLVIPMTLPFVLFCMGATELVSGTPFSSIASSWNRMGEIKQGIFSFFLLWAGLALIGLAIYVAVRFLAP